MAFLVHTGMLFHFHDTEIISWTAGSSLGSVTKSSATIFLFYMSDRKQVERKLLLFHWAASTESTCRRHFPSLSSLVPMFWPVPWRLGFSRFLSTSLSEGWGLLRSPVYSTQPTQQNLFVFCLLLYFQVNIWCFADKQAQTALLPVFLNVLSHLLQIMYALYQLNYVAETDTGCHFSRWKSRYRDLLAMDM